MNPAIVVLGASTGRTAAERLADIDDSPLTSLCAPLPSAAGTSHDVCDRNKYKYRILIAFALPIAVLFFEVYMPMYASSAVMHQELDTIDAHIDLDPPVAVTGCLFESLANRWCAEASPETTGRSPRRAPRSNIPASSSW